MMNKNNEEVLSCYVDAPNTYSENQEKRVLVIDDDYSTLKLLKHYMSGFGFDQILTYTEGSQGLTSLMEHHPNLLVVDLYLLDTNGLKLIRLLESMGVKDLSVLLISHHNFTEKIINEHFQNLKVSFLKKPLFKDELHSKIKELMAS